MFSSGARLGINELLAIAAIAGTVMFIISFSKWRFAVKSAFVLVLFEGAIRKWFLPGQQEVVYFLKDFIITGAYARYYLFPDPEIRARKLAIPAFLMALLSAVVALSALNPNLNSVIVAIYGLKIYFYYIPLAFMIPYLYRSQDEFIRSITNYALLATPICLLGVAQFAVPSASILNVYAETGDETVITTFAGTETARITGTFSYLTGHTTFVVIFFTLHLALLTTKQSRIRWVWLLVNVPLLTANAFMGGSRACVVSLFAVAAAFLVLSVTKSGNRGSSKIWMAAIAVCGIIIASLLVFDRALDQWRFRSQTASDTYWERIVAMPLESLKQAADSQGMLGYGIGVSHPVTYRIRSALGLPSATREPPLFDTEPARVLVELGFAGFLAWYGLRLLVLKSSFSTFRMQQPGDLKTLVLAATLVQPPFFLMSMVLNHTASFLLWGAYGVALIPWLRDARPQRHRQQLPSRSGEARAAPNIPSHRTVR